MEFVKLQRNSPNLQNHMIKTVQITHQLVCLPVNGVVWPYEFLSLKSPARFSINTINPSRRTEKKKITQKGSWISSPLFFDSLALIPVSKRPILQSELKTSNQNMGLKKGSWKFVFPSCFGHSRNRSSNGVLKRKFRRSVKRLCSSRIAPDLDVFTLAEVKKITHNFSVSSFLGEGGFGPVYKGVIDEKIRPGFKALEVAVKVLDLDGNQGHTEWLAEVVFLGQLRHPHLVKLIGYCSENEQRVLIYEYLAKGNLENQLLRRNSSSLPWTTRIKIALDAAKGLAFLHDEEHPVIFRDIKASNILLDSDYNAKLSDFGLAKDGPEDDETHVTTRVMGTEGYAAPEYIMTGHLTTMSDVYSFGVVLLELLTGRRSTDKTRPSREQNLVAWARPFLREPQKVEQIIDPKLEGMFSMEGAKMVAVLAYQCLSQKAKFRPRMSAVVKTLETVLELPGTGFMPFVYVVPKQGQKNESEAETDHNNGEEGGKRDEHKETGRNKCAKGIRHSHRLNQFRSGSVYPENKFYIGLQTGINCNKSEDVSL